MTNEQLNKYYEQVVDKGHCLLNNSQCPLKEHCNGIARDKCKEYTPIEYQWVIDETIKSYLNMEEERFIKRYLG